MASVAVAVPRADAERSALSALGLAKLLYLILVAAVPFEAFDFGPLSRAFSLARLLGLPLILVAMTIPKRCFGRANVLVWGLMTFTCVYAVGQFFINPSSTLSSGDRLKSLAQMFLLAWIGFNLMQDSKFRARVVLAIGWSCAALSLLAAFGIGVEVLAWGDEAARVTLFGENPNTIGAVLALGFLCLIGSAFNPGLSRPRWQKVVLVLAAFLVLQAIVNTGSRGAMLALGAGAVAMVMAAPTRELRTKGWIGLAVIWVLMLGSIAVTPIAAQRWLQTLEERNLSQRDKLAPIAVDLILERPIFGWGPEDAIQEMGRRVRQNRKDPHNLYLYVMIETGLVGGIPFFLAFFGSLYLGWKARRTELGSLAFALMVTLAMINMSDSWQNRKYLYVVLALASAAGCAALRPSQTEPHRGSAIVPKALPEPQ